MNRPRAIHSSILIGTLLAALMSPPAVFAAASEPARSDRPAGKPDEQRRVDDWGYRMGPGMMGGQYGGGGPGMMGGHYGGAGPGMMGGFHGGGPGMMGGFHGGGPWMMGMHCGWIVGAVDLSRDQETRANRICDELRKKHWDLAGTMMTESERLRDLNNADKRDPAVIGQQFAKIQAIQRQMLELSIDAENQLDAVLTPEQKERYRAIHRRAWR